MPHDDADLLHLAQGNATQARKRVAADLLIRDQGGRILLVNPTYKDRWDLPGGMAEANEPPRKAAERELAEELGLTITAGRLLTLDWIAPHGPWDDHLLFIFDGGTLTPDQLVNVHIHDPEIAEYAFLSSDDARHRLRREMARRLTRIEQAETTLTVAYSEHQGSADPVR